MQVFRRVSLVAASFAAIVSADNSVSAQTPEEFYKGKSIDLVIGYPPGGSNDTWGRILARHIGKQLPGKPNVVPKNMPGAGSFLAVNQVFNVLPKDGTIIGIGAPRACASRPPSSIGSGASTRSSTWCSCGRPRR